MIRFLIALILLFLSISFTTCSKVCEPEIAACYDFPPSDEECRAFFTRWFFNQHKDECEIISYSGCHKYGFETKEDCTACQCSE